MHVNDTFGTAMAKGVRHGPAKIRHAVYKIFVDEIACPRSRRRAIFPSKLAKAKASNPDALMVTSRLNDLNPDHAGAGQAALDAASLIMSMGPGWIENQYLKTLGKLSDGPMGFPILGRIRTRS